MPLNRQNIGFFLLLLLFFGCTQLTPNLPEVIPSDQNEPEPIVPVAPSPTPPLPDSNSLAPSSDGNSVDINAPDANILPLPTAPVSQRMEFVEWQYENGWKPRTSPPPCPEIFIEQSPIDVTLATSVLYPGQERGGDYKPHGGFRFDDSKNSDIQVVVPLEGYVTDGSRYLEKGELQYQFDIIHPCGIMYRFDHLRELSPEFLAMAQQFREPVEGDSRGTWITPVLVDIGDVIATAVGVPGNTGMDFGLYDLRQKNEASKKSAWLNETDSSQAPYALCWLTMLPEPDATIVQKLPAADGQNGKKSEYCD